MRNQYFLAGSSYVFLPLLLSNWGQKKLFFFLNKFFFKSRATRFESIQLGSKKKVNSKYTHTSMLEQKYLRTNTVSKKLAGPLCYSVLTYSQSSRYAGNTFWKTVATINMYLYSLADYQMGKHNATLIDAKSAAHWMNVCACEMSAVRSSVVFAAIRCGGVAQ